MPDLANLPYPPSFGGIARSPAFGGRGRVSYLTGAGVAGAYSVSVTQPAGSVLLDIVLTAVALWNAGTSATGIVGDTGDDDGYFTGIDCKATDWLATEQLSFALAGGKAGAYIAVSQANKRYTVADRAITLKITTVGTATTGESIMDVFWLWPSRGETAGTFV